MYKRILVPLDGSDTAKLALAAGLQMAHESGGQVRLIQVLDDVVSVGMYEYSGDLLRHAREYAAKVLAEGQATAQAAGVPADTKLVESAGRRLGDVVAHEATEWDADLVAVGTHGRRGVNRVLLGSGAEQIARLAPVPVLLVRSDEAD
jgi:nucleotide-binding universal stress UspA family protein